MEIGRIQQNNPAASFKANIKVWNAEPRLESMIQKSISNWEYYAKRIGNNLNNVCVTISPFNTGYGLTYADQIRRSGITSFQQTDVSINVFSDVIPNYFRNDVIKTDKELSPISLEEIGQKIDRTVTRILEEMGSGRMLF